MEEGEIKPGQLETFKAWFRDDLDALLTWRREALIDYNFAAPGGEKQWEEADRNALKAQQRPCISFQRILPVIQSVVGQEINQRAEITYKPRTTQDVGQSQGGAVPGQVPGQPGMGMPMPSVPGADDQGPAETLSAAAQYLRDQCDAEDEESDAFQDTVVCGMGWVETRVDYEDNPDGDLKEDRIDPLEMVWDCKAQKRNLIDMRRVWRVREIDKFTAKNEFPDVDLSKLDASWARLDEQKEPHDRELARHYDNNPEFDANRKTVTLVECQWWKLKTEYVTVNPMTQETVRLEDKKQADNYAKNIFTATGQQVPVSTHRKRVYYTTIIGREILSNEESQSQKTFKYQAITGYRDRNAKQWVGLVRSMRDPQRWANALASSILHQIQTTGKGVMAERGAFENDAEAERNWANGSKIVWLKAGALAGQQIQQKEQHNLPQGIFEFMTMLGGMFRDVTGVNVEAMGLADRQQAASLEYQRRQAATTILAPFFDGLRRFRKDNGRLLLDLIKSYLSDGRLVRVVGPDYEKYVPLIKQDDTIEYDIIIDESPSSPNQKEASWAILQQILPVLGKDMPPQTVGKLLKASPLPESVVDDFVESAEQVAQNAGPPPEVVQMQMMQEEHQHDMQMNEQKGQLDAAKAQADIQLKQMDIFLKGQEIELAKFQAQTDMQMKTQEMGFKQQEMQGKSREGEVQRQHDMQMRKMEIGGQIDTEMMKNPEMMGSLTSNLNKGLEALGKALVQSNQVLAEGLGEMAEAQKLTAQALMAPKITQLSPDGTTATTRPDGTTATTRAVN